MTDNTEIIVYKSQYTQLVGYCQQHVRNLNEKKLTSISL